MLQREIAGEGNVIQLMNAIPNHIVNASKRGGGTVRAQKDKFYRSGYGAAQIDEAKMKRRTSG